MKKGPIILIEDDIDDQELIVEILQDLKVENEIIHFGNGAQAFTYLVSLKNQAGEAKKPFLIISDINMPVMNGLELRRHILKDDVLRKMSIPFIYLSTSNDRRNVDAAYEMEVQGYFEKSYQLDLMQSMLHQIYQYWQLCRHPDQ